jgi:hypothetical protein
MAQTFDIRFARSVKLEDRDTGSARRRGFARRLAALLVAGAVTLGIAPPALAANPSAGGIVPIVPGNPTYAVARRQLDLFLSESKALRADYLSIRSTPTVERLQALEARWQKVTSRIYGTAEFAGIDFLGLRELELAISRSWRGYLSLHAEGLRARDKTKIEQARTHLAFTEALEALLPQFVR